MRLKPAIPQRLLALATICVLVASGCSSSPAPTSLGEKTEKAATPDPTDETSAPAIGSAAYKEALADGDVTEDEYLAGFERYRSCLSAAGFELKDPSRDGPLMTFLVPGAAVSNGDDKKCYEAEFMLLDAAWQGKSHTDFTEDINSVIKCLTNNGIDPGVKLGAASDEETQKRLKALKAEADLSKKCAGKY